MELDAVVALLISLGAQCKSLAALAARVDKVDIINLEVWRVGAESGSLVVVRGVVLALFLGNGDGVGFIGRGVGRVAVDCQRGFQGLDVDLFGVGALVEEDALCGGAAFAEGIDGGLEG